MQPKPVEDKLNEKAENQATIPIKNIGVDEIKIAVQVYADTMKALDRMFEFALFNEREVQLENGKLIFTLENEIQKSQLNAYKAAFIKYLKDEFDSNFTLDAEIATNNNETKKLLYTPTDKYNFLADKYPVLDELKNCLLYTSPSPRD